MAKIFISYRRDDTGFGADRVHEAALDYVSDPADVFMDIDGIPPGADFVKFIEQRVAQCDVLFALIGREWLDIRDPDTGKRRLDDPEDFVRLEIASALERDIPVVPVLMGEAPMPRAADLPDDLKPLARRNARRVGRASFKNDMAELMKGLGLARATVDATGSAASEFAWETIELSLDKRDYVHFIEMFPTSGRAFEARRRITQLEDWAQVDESDHAAINAFRAEARAKSPLFPALEQRTVVIRDLARARDREAERATDAGREEVSDKDVELSQREVYAKGQRQLVMIIGPFIFLIVIVVAAVELFAPGATGLFAQTPKSPSESSDVDSEIAIESPFRDCAECPEMVVVPAGTFTMGSPSSEAGRRDEEGPQRTVRISYSFAAGKTEVTWAEWEACVADGGCSNSGPDSAGGDEGWGKGSRPVINVSWEDSQAFVAWLSRKTGEQYRLLSEAEWEYVARAGTSTRFSWGDGDPTCSRGASNGANFSSCTSRRTEPAGFSAANAFGLHDLHGNVWEWTEDCYQDSYSGAPTDGSALVVSDCSLRVLRGGSWLDTPVHLRSANRGWVIPTNRNVINGFRVARTL